MHGLTRRHEIGQTTFPNLFLTLTLAHFCRLSLGGEREIPQRREDTLQFDQVRIIHGEHATYLLQRWCEDRRPGVRGKRETLVVEVDDEGPFIVAQANLALFEDLPILVPEHRQ